MVLGPYGLHRNVHADTRGYKGPRQYVRAWLSGYACRCRRALLCESMEITLTWLLVNWLIFVLICVFVTMMFYFVRDNIRF